MKWQIQILVPWVMTPCFDLIGN